MKNRVLSLVIALCIILCTFPLTAFAEEAATPLNNPTRTSGLLLAESQSFDPELPPETRPIGTAYAMQGSDIAFMRTFNDDYKIDGSWFTVRLVKSGETITLPNALHVVDRGMSPYYSSADIHGVQNLQAGDYTLYVDCPSYTAKGSLHILAPGEKMIVNVSGSGSAARLRLEQYSHYYDWLYDDYSSPYGTFALAPRVDGKQYIVISVFGYNITPSDITGVNFVDFGSRPIPPFSAPAVAVLPACGKTHGGMVELYLVIAPPEEITNEPETFINVVAAPGVSFPGYVQVVETYNYNDFWVDYSDIANLKIALVSEKIHRPLPDTLTIELNIPGSTVYTLTAVRSGNRYIINLPENTYFYNDLDYLSFRVSAPITPYPYYIRASDIAPLYFPSEISTEIDGRTFFHTPITRGINSESATLSLADSSFAPVSSVKMTRNYSDNNLFDNRYIFSAESPLVDGAVYYIMYGKLPIKKITAKTVPTPGEESSINNIFLPEFVGHQGLDSFEFRVDTEAPVNPLEWSVKLISKIPGGKTYTLNTVNSTPRLSCDVSIYNPNYASFYVKLDQIDPGPYNVEYYINGVKQTKEQFPELNSNSYFYCHSSLNNTRLKRIYLQYWEGAEGPRGAALCGTGNLDISADPSGWKLYAYKMDSVFVDFSPVVIDIPTLAPGGSTNYFQFELPNALLKASGITPGIYWVAIADKTGKVFNADQIMLTAKFLNNELNIVSSPLSTIVAGYGADIPVNIKNIANSVASGKLFDPNGNLVGSFNGTFGLIFLTTAIQGVYVLKAYENGVFAGEYTISCVAPPTDLWSPLLLPGVDTFQVAFAADVLLKDASLSVGGTKVTDFTSSGKVVTVNAPASGTVVLSGVKFPALFSSYKFTFTLTV